MKKLIAFFVFVAPLVSLASVDSFAECPADSDDVTFKSGKVYSDCEIENARTIRVETGATLNDVFISSYNQYLFLLSCRSDTASYS